VDIFCSRCGDGCLLQILGVDGDPATLYRREGGVFGEIETRGECDFHVIIYYEKKIISIYFFLKVLYFRKKLRLYTDLILILLNFLNQKGYAKMERRHSDRLNDIFNIHSERGKRNIINQKIGRC